MKILIVDDHPIVRAGLRRLLGGEPDNKFTEAASAKEAFDLANALQPDLIILDLNLPGMGGLDVIGRLVQIKPRPQILVLSMHDDPIFAARALEEGAQAYVSKNAPPTEIIDAMERLASGQTYVSQELAQQLVSWNLRPTAHPLKSLSRRDLEILRLLAEGRNIQQIADTLEITYKTVSNNCSQIKAKLGVRRTAELVRFAINSGALNEGTNSKGE
jgi:two-component system, NarL family, invasion response regulator UvrY